MNGCSVCRERFISTVPGLSVKSMRFYKGEVFFTHATCARNVEKQVEEFEDNSLRQKQYVSYILAMISH
jgi:hypothetical protein